MTNFEEVGNLEFWTPGQGEQLIGTVVRTTNTQYGDAYVIKTEDGDEYGVNYTALNDFLAESMGQTVKLVCQGKNTGKNGQKYKVFKTYRAK